MAGFVSEFQDSEQLNMLMDEESSFIVGSDDLPSFTMSFEESSDLNMGFEESNSFMMDIEEGGGGTSDYTELENLPKINGVTLVGNKTSNQLGVQEKINDLDDLREGAALAHSALQTRNIDNNTLKIENNILKVNTTNNASEDNTKPITSAGVYTIVGNIDALLEII